MCISCLESFTDKAKFSEHLQSRHGNLVAGSQLEALVLQCEEPVDKIPASGCLLCDEWESNLLDPKQDSKRLFLNNGEIVEPCGTLGQFRRHLGRHMEQLALFALPMAEEDEMEDDSLEEDSDDGDDDVKGADVTVDREDKEILGYDSDDYPVPEDLKGPILKRVQELKIADFNEVGKVILGEFPYAHPVEANAANRGLFTFLMKNLTRNSSGGATWEVKPEVASIYSPVSPDPALDNERNSPETTQGHEKVDSYSEDFYYSFLFKWEHPASEVYVTGTFDDWSKSEKLIQAGNVFEKNVMLPRVEKIHYKFVVDGNWVTDHTAPQETDASGNLNNIVTTDRIVKHTVKTTSSNVTSTAVLAPAESSTTQDLTLENERNSPETKEVDENIDSHSEDFYSNLINMAVPLGPQMLRRTYRNNPGISSHIRYIRLKVDLLSSTIPVTWRREFNNLIDEMSQQGEATQKSHLMAYHHKIVDIAIGRGPAALRDVLERYPLLLANTDYYAYLRQAVGSLPAPKQKLMQEHIIQVLNLTIVIKSIPVAIKKDQFLGIMDGLALPTPETLSFQQDSGIFKGRAFARYATTRDALRAISVLNDCEIQGRTLRVESMNFAAVTGDSFSLHARGPEQTIHIPAEAGSEEVTTSKTNASKVTVAESDSLENSVIDLTPDNFDEVIIPGKPVLVAFVASWSEHWESVYKQLAQLAQNYAFARDRLTIASVDKPYPQASLQRFRLQQLLFAGLDLGVFPRIKYFDGKSEEPEQYVGNIDLESLTQFLIEKTGLKPRRSGAVVAAEPGSVETLEATQQLVNRSVASNNATVGIPPEFPTAEDLPSLSNRAITFIRKYVLRPLETETSLRTFHSISVGCIEKIYDKDILCLRDVQKYLLSQAATSATSSDEYLTFCHTAIGGIEVTVDLLNVDELTRSDDPPFTREYFFGLLEMVKQHAQRLRDRMDKETKGKGREDISDSTPDFNLQPDDLHDKSIFSQEGQGQGPKQEVDFDEILVLADEEELARGPEILCARCKKRGHYARE